MLSKSKTNASTALRLCKLDDSDYWLKLRESQGKRLAVSLARVNLASFTTPNIPI